MRATLRPKAASTRPLKHRKTMLSFFRRVSNSKIGTGIMAVILVAILAGFALSDISNFGSGKIGFFGLGNSTLASAGKFEISDREMSNAMERQLQRVREQKPDADYATIVGDFDPILDQLIDERALLAFADKYHFVLSKRLVDAEIAQLPGVRGLNGEVSQQGYQAFLAQQRLSDEQVRQILTAGLLQRLMLTPLVTNARVSVGAATPYASMLLEARQGEALVVPVEAFTANLKPTDADLQGFYAANRARYVVPEQRVLRIATIGPEQVASVTPSEQEIAAYYNANQATYGSRETRVLSQAVVPDRKVAEAIAARAKAGGTFVAAAAPAGLGAADVSLGEQSRAQFQDVVGNAVAQAAFSAKAGAVVGPIQSDLGWHVIKVESVKPQTGKSLAAAHSEIAAKLTADKRKQALEDLVDRVQTALDDGRNFAEAAGVAKLPVTTTPLITPAGTSRTDPAYRAPAALAPAIKTGFDMGPNDEPEIVTLPNGAGYALVSPGQVVPAAPPPLASIRDQVAKDWITAQGLARARAAADRVAAQANSNVPLGDAAKAAGVPLPAVRPIGGRRIEIAQSGPVSPPMKLLFTTGAGKSRVAADAEGRGFFVVKVTRIVPGNALLQPALIARMQKEMQGQIPDEYARQFVNAVRSEVKVRKNDDAIAAEKKRLAGGS